MHTGILDQLNITREPHCGMQLAMRSDDELAAIICGMEHPRFENMLMAEIRKDELFVTCFNKGRVHLYETAVKMIRSLDK